MTLAECSAGSESAPQRLNETTFSRPCELALPLDVGLTTLQRWRRQFTDDGDGVDRRKCRWLEIDLVAHCGGRLEGRFIWTLVATDIATAWSESLPVITRDGASVLAAIQRLRQQFPSPCAGSMRITIQLS